MTGMRVFAAEPTHVIVDPSDKYITTFVGLPKDIPEKEFVALKESLSQRPGSYIVTWQEFKLTPEKYIRPNIRRNDYPDVDVVGGLEKLLERYDGTPFGLTWNGGLAVTHDDYAYAARTYAPFADRRADPLHPLNHLEPLLRK